MTSPAGVIQAALLLLLLLLLASFQRLPEEALASTRLLAPPAVKRRQLRNQRRGISSKGQDTAERYTIRGRVCLSMAMSIIIVMFICCSSVHRLRYVSIPTRNVNCKGKEHVPAINTGRHQRYVLHKTIPIMVRYAPIKTITLHHFNYLSLTKKPSFTQLSPNSSHIKSYFKIFKIHGSSLHTT